LEAGLPSRVINAIAEGPDGYIWMASEGAGLLRYDGKSYENFGLDEFPVLQDVQCDSSGVLWFHNGRRLWFYDGLNFKEFPLPELASIKQLKVFEKKHLLLNSGLYNILSDSLVEIPTPNIPINNFAFFKGVFFLQSDVDIWRTRGRDWEKLASDSANFQAKANCQSILINDSVFFDSDLMKPILINGSSNFLGYAHNGDFHVYIDSENIFVNLAKDSLRIPFGLAVNPAEIKEVFISSNGVVFLILREGLLKLNDLATFKVRSQSGVFCALKHGGNYYAGTEKGLEVYDRDYKLIKRFDLGFILSLAAFKGAIYIGTEAGLYRYNLASEEMKALGLKGFVFSIIAHNSMLWLGAGDGIYKFADGAFTNVSFEEGLAKATVFSIKKDREGALWFASYTEGLWRLKDDKWQAFRKWGDLNLDSIGFSAFLPLSKDRILLGTPSDGLFDLRSDRSIHYGLRQLDFAEIHDIQEWNGEFWLGTNKGALSYRELSLMGQQQSASSLHFLKANASLNGSYSNSEEIVYASSSGLFILQMDWLKAQVDRAKKAGLVAINRLQSSDESLMTFGEDTLAFDALPIGLELPFDYNYLRFNYGSKNLYRQEYIQFRYRLAGLSDGWNYVSSFGEAIYPDLAAGGFHFELQSRYAWEPWPLKSESYAFEIKEAYWRTWWFISFVFLSAVVFTTVLVRDRWLKTQQRLGLENELLEMERKALRLQMNPHFIFNALDSISSFIFVKDAKQAVRYLNNFAKLMRLTLESSMEHVHPVETELSILKNYLELEKLRFNDKFEYELLLDEEIDYDVGMPPMLIQPHVENAILHGLKPLAGAGLLKVSFTVEGDNLCCVIDDNGVGRSAKKSELSTQKHRSMATQINKDRIALLQRSIKGEVILKIIDKTDENGKATGTTVIIKLPIQNI
jgi:ligand-binding sensor domain-containing protein